MKYSPLLHSLVFALAACTTTLKTENAKTSIQYPDPAPDSTALTFLEGLVSTKDTLEFNAAFSPDGKSYYFSRGKNGTYDMYVSSYNETGWGVPVTAPFTEKDYAEADPFFGPDGKLYFISNKPVNTLDTTRDFNIWRIAMQADGKWSAPENLEAVNSDSTEYYVSLSENGNLYFASDRTGGLGSHDIYISRFINGQYTTPQNLGTAINTPQMEHDPFISADEQTLIFTSVNRADSYGSADIYYSKKDNEGNWTPAKNLGKRVNTATYDYCSYITPDNHYFFYSSNNDVKWIDIRYLELH
jgi:Tol biopolymer transport system component